VLIRHYFPGTNPETLSDDEYNKMIVDAHWLEERKMQLMANAIAMAFGE
jgi:hypothetical protein